MAAIQLHQIAGDGEAEAGAAKAPRGGSAGLLKGPEQAQQVGGRDADAGIGETPDQPAIRFAAQADLDAATLLVELDGIGQKIEADLFDGAGIGLNTPAG